MAKRKVRRGRKSGQRIFRPLLTEGPHKGKPKCVHEGCQNPGQHTGNRRVDGSVIYRSQCDYHHGAKIAKKHKLPSLLHVMAKKAGYDDTIDYVNSKHEYRHIRKTCCENTDGRLGFVCTSTIAHKSMLEVDHINNNHKDNRETNLHTLCANCHRYKTMFFGHLKDLKYIKKLFKKNADTQKAVQLRNNSV